MPVNTFVADGRTGANIEAQINAYVTELRKTLRPWAIGFDGQMCVYDGTAYVLASGGDSTVDPSLNSGDWNVLASGASGDGGSVASGSLADLATAAETFFVVEGEATSSNNGCYILFEGSYAKLWPSSGGGGGVSTTVFAALLDASTTDPLVIVADNVDETLNGVYQRVEGSYHKVS